MDTNKNTTKPWNIADLLRPNAETRTLIPEHLRGYYDGLVEQRSQSQRALHDACAKVYEAQKADRAAQEQLTAFFAGAGAMAESATIQLGSAPKETEADIMRFPSPAEAAILAVAA